MTRRHPVVDNINEQIGKNLYNIRLEKGLTRKQLCSKIAISDQQLQKYETGSNRISAARLVLLSKVLNISPLELLKSDHLSSDNNITQNQRVCGEVLRNFRKIKSPHVQKTVNHLIKSLIDDTAIVEKV